MKCLIRNDISEFETIKSKNSNDSIVKNKQILNSKIEILLVISIIKVAIMYFFVSISWEHYPNKANNVTLLR